METTLTCPAMCYLWVFCPEILPASFALITLLQFIQLVVALELSSTQCERCITVDDIIVIDGKSQNSFIFTFCFCQPSYLNHRDYLDTLTRSLPLTSYLVN